MSNQNPHVPPPSGDAADSQSDDSGSDDDSSQATSTATLVSAWDNFQTLEPAAVLEDPAVIVSFMRNFMKKDDFVKNLLRLCCKCEYYKYVMGMLVW